MTVRFRHPPLVELIAELRWGPQLPGGQQRGGVLLPTGSHEEFFMRFGSRAGALGYERVERLVPPGFPPIIPFQAIYRFRKRVPEEGTTLYQIGAGVFSANITPPYQSWQDFRPIVEEGVRILLETRDPSERNAPFTSVNLRYINSFDHKFSQGRSTASFMREVLGFAIELPTAVQAEIALNADVKPALQLAFPLKSGQQMSLTLAEGQVASEQAVIMDITASVAKPVSANADDVMAEFEGEHEVIHRIFAGATKRIYQIMEPIEAS